MLAVNDSSWIQPQTLRKMLRQLSSELTFTI